MLHKLAANYHWSVIMLFFRTFNTVELLGLRVFAFLLTFKAYEQSVKVSVAIALWHLF
jgi:hypothetical protein